jgi:agmatine deiminase
MRADGEVGRGAPAEAVARRPAKGTPAAEGYAMPAEWEPHAATWLAWPHDPVTFRDLEAAERAFAAMVAALSGGERVELLVKDAATAARAKAALAAAGARALGRGGRPRGVRLRRVPTADSWIRDYGPTFLVRRSGKGPRRAFVRWRFNAWGEKYETLLADDGIPDRLGLRMPRFAPRLVMEGGSIDVDGEGTVLVTEQCQLNANRNPSLPRERIEARLSDHLGATRCLWLGEGVVGDDTDGHVDDLARFVGPATVFVASEDDPKDGNHAPLEDARRRLEAATDARGRRLTVVPMGMPGALFAGDRRLPASYANFYVGNEVVLFPAYGPKANDERAAKLLRRAFPTRRVVPIDCREVVYGYGSIHCVTQQEPA